MTNTQKNDFNFGDKRINERFFQACIGMQKSQSSLISNWSDKPKEREGFYRLFSNEKFSTDKIFDGHFKSVKRSLDENTEDDILAISDTTSITLGVNPDTPNIGRISSKKAPVYGLFAHTTLLVNAETNASYGIANQSYFFHKEAENKAKDDQSESKRWIEGFYRTHEKCDSRVIHVTDREGDMFELIEAASLSDARFIIRQKHGREVLLKKNAYSEETIFDRIELNELGRTHEIKRPDTTLYFRVRHTKVLIVPPKDYSRNFEIDIKAEPIEVNVIQVAGEDSSGEMFNWVIFSNLEIKNEYDAIKIINLYSKRWHIESFHKVLKTGMNIEDCQLEDGLRIEKIIAMNSIIAAKGYAVLQMSRTGNPPDIRFFFDPNEIKALEVLTGEKNLTLRKVVHCIARKGGFIKNKKYPEPGILTFWRGWYRNYEKFEFLVGLARGEIALNKGF
jgi:hypothetical protein